MNSSDFTRNTIEAAIRLGMLLLLAVWCFTIIKPFILPIVWAVIIAVAVFPIFLKLKSALGGRNKLAATLYTLIALALLITPTVLVSNSLVESSNTLVQKYDEGSLIIPPPNDSVKTWPLIGEQVHEVWLSASENIETTFQKYKAEVKKLSKAVVSAATSAGGTILQFVLSVIISGIFIAYSDASYKLTVKFMARLTNDKSGKEFVDLAKMTIRSVAQGVLGIALIQALLSAAGMAVMGVPGWGLWTLLVLVVAIAQLPPILILGFVIAYVFSVAETTPAVIFLIYCILVSFSDAILKPMLLGRGMSIPMPIILIGAIGGMIASGIIGLFVGAIILALAYELFLAWLDDNKSQVAAE
ncbi:MAG: AI-2E family transporter [Gammaproteobacteria bacterium]